MVTGIVEEKMSEKKLISILGITGSVGQSAQAILLSAPDQYQVQAVTAYSKVHELAVSAKLLNAKLAVIADASNYEDLKAALVGTGIEAAAGEQAILEATQRPAHIILNAIVGFAALLPTLSAIKQGNVLALANKEILVCSGEMVMNMAHEYGCQVLPVDSEHSGIFQVLESRNFEAIRSVTLTASGGPFWKKSLEQMKGVTPEEAVAHPIWRMGAKISVDSATMMNKGLEVIEAHYLFNLPEEKIKILVHPQSIIHGMVEYDDGSVLAQLAVPDMRTPISVAFSWPERRHKVNNYLNLAEVGQLSFALPDEKRFPALVLAREALKSGSGACTILNAANEIAVMNFLSRKIAFLDIMRVVSETISGLNASNISSLEELLDLDSQARQYSSSICKKLLV